jgi:hypothetical protein
MRDSLVEGVSGAAGEKLVQSEQELQLGVRPLWFTTTLSPKAMIEINTHP